MSLNVTLLNNLYISFSISQSTLSGLITADNHVVGVCVFYVWFLSFWAICGKLSSFCFLVIVASVFF